MATESEKRYLPVKAKKNGSNTPYAPLNFFIFSGLWGLITVGLAQKFAVYNIWIVVAGVLLFSVPIFLCGFYSATVCQIRRLNIFHSKGLVYQLFSKRIFKLIVWILWALITSFFMLIQFHTYDRFEWLIYFLVIPVFWVAFVFSRRFFVNELKPYLVTHSALHLARMICPVFMLFVFVMAHINFDNSTIYPSLDTAITMEKNKVADMTGSALVMETSQFLGFYNGMKAYALYKISLFEPNWMVLFLCLGSLVVYFNACAILSCFLIPLVEYRRILAPLSEDTTPPKPSTSKVIMTSAVFVFVAIFVYLPIITGLEKYFLQTPHIKEGREQFEKQTVQVVELIGEEVFRPGTINELQEAKIQSLQEIQVAYIRLETHLDRAFARLEYNVDDFLDWYYSLLGEYTRIGMLLVGELETYMIEKMEEYLTQGDVFSQFESELNAVITQYNQVQQAYEKKAGKILEKNRIDISGKNLDVVQKISIDEMMNAPIHQDIISMEKRLLASGGGTVVTGVITAVVVKKIIAKVIAKNTIKTAAAMLIKVVGGKALSSSAGAAAGAGIGAAAGTVVPGVGTAFGAVIGAAIGITAGVSVDKLLIELEEMWSRDQFKAEIMKEINNTKMGMKALFQ
jgi:hypothetical protein